ncbi:alpha/beta fold hydrolase [Spirochaeta isovalerica]|uniref:Pimeloyl-ACP methyl ester carboxylesterase n=1 Tax=Spirochaeta isovalerica TaxID=150 RepID=A0A841RBB2_9SPIO|nr:alpha/beta hydrolase [Spirochaeta isovalerica]MBB6479702.1 pimeloyl-ACP methyl ester carboxylesterase [Spirochaeta isovalerica]
MNAKWIFIHGGWGGSWQWTPVQERLNHLGIDSSAPDLPGMGSAKGRQIDLTDFIDHISSIIGQSEGSINLAGFSFGGMTATAVAERHRDRIGKLVYIDAFVPRSGQSFSHIAGEKITRQIKAYSHVMGEENMIPPFFETDSRYCSHPLKTLFTPVHYSDSSLDDLNPIYIECTSKDDEWTFTPLLRKVARSVRNRGWKTFTIPSDHMPMYTHTEELLKILL